MAPPDLLPHLRQVASLKPGSQLPDWMKTGDTSALISQLCGQAADEIERLTVLEQQQNTQASAPK